MRPERIPLFPLDVVLLPGTHLPLHIFELRYRHMVRRCIEESSEFGILLALPNGVAGVGCTAEIIEVIKRYEDGKMDIQTIGRAPFQVTELFTGNPLLEGRVNYLEGGDEPIAEPVEHELIELFEACYTLVFGDFPRDIEERNSHGSALEAANPGIALGTGPPEPVGCLVAGMGPASAKSEPNACVRRWERPWPEELMGGDPE